MSARFSPLEDVEETRIALSFSGGVALAVYESGVALELFRLVSDDAYAPLRERIGRVVVDVITGTSAGGLNGAFLANALVNQGDIWQLLPLWRDKADLNVLLYPPNQSEPQSLLDGDYFRDEILNALAAKGTGQAGKGPLQDAVDLFITATNLDGCRVDFNTPDGEDIATQTYRQVFHFQYRDDGPQGQAKNDFRGDANIQRLAIAARSTASFPGAFAPVLIDKAFMGHVVENLAETGQSYHMDGGVLDNKPIGLALNAIDSRPAKRRVSRHLFFIEPDPDVIRVRAAQAGPQPYGPLEVIYQALIGLPSYQSITNALDQLQQRNKTAAQRRRMLDGYDKAAGAFQAKACRKSEADDNPVRQIEADTGPPPHDLDNQATFQFAGPARFDSAFYRAIEDGYLDLRLKSLDRLAPPSARLSQCFDELTAAMSAALEDEAKVALPMASAGATNPEPIVSTADAAEVWPLRCLLYRLKSLIVAHLDLRFYERYYDYLTGGVLKQYPDRPSGTGDGDGVAFSFYLAAAQSLNELARRCSDQLATLKELDRRSADLHAAECVQLAAELQAAREIIAGRMEHYRQESDEKRRFVMRRSDLAPVLQGLLAEIEKRPFHRDRCAFFNAMRRADWEKLRNAVLPIVRAPTASQGAPRQAYRAGLIHGYWVLRDAMESFYMRDLMLYPLMQGGELQTEIEEIKFARISPDDADVFRQGLSASDKLAGELLWHFGGFLKKSWRGNDLIWGRLDAAEIIVKNLWPNSAHDPACLKFIEKLQADILADMWTNYGLSIFDPPTSRATADLIGKQTMSAVSGFDRFRWLLTGLLTGAKILGDSVAESQFGAYLPARVRGWAGSFFTYATMAVILDRISVQLGKILAGRLLGFAQEAVNLR